MDGKEFNDWQDFGIRVKNARNSIGMTVETLAEKSHRTENFILRIESGKKSCSIHTLYQFCKSMNIPADDLLFGGKVEEKNYSDKEIIENIIQKCNEKQLKIVKDVLVTMFSDFDELIK